MKVAKDKYLPLCSYFVIGNSMLKFSICFVPPNTERINSESKAIFEDVVDDFHSIPIIQSKFERWKLDYSESYQEAYIGLCLSKLYSPFIRLQLIDWNPLEVSCFTAGGKDGTHLNTTLKFCTKSACRNIQGCAWSNQEVFILQWLKCSISPIYHKVIQGTWFCNKSLGLKGWLNVDSKSCDVLQNLFLWATSAVKAHKAEEWSREWVDV